MQSKITRRERWRWYKRTQRLYPLEGKVCDCWGCGSRATNRHHCDGDITNLERENVALLCDQHHNDAHARRPRKLSMRQIYVVRGSRETSTVLGKRYGLSASYIRNIKSGWRLTG